MSQELKQNENNNLDERIDDFLSELEEFMEQEDIKELNIEEDKIANQTFSIETKEQANFFIKQVLEAKAQKEEIENTAKEMIAREKAKIERWAEKETNRIQSSIDYMSGLLQNFAESELDKTNSKKKSISLPNGSIGFRAQQPKYEYDDKILLSYLQENNREDLISYKPSVAHSELKKQGQIKDGQMYLGKELVPGVSVILQDPKFEVKE